jgi:integrase
MYVIARVYPNPRWRRFWGYSAVETRGDRDDPTVKIGPSPVPAADWTAGAREGQADRAEALAAGRGRQKARGGRRAVTWVGFHSFRHTCATLLFLNGWNVVQVQRWLGHHKPSFSSTPTSTCCPSTCPIRPSSTRSAPLVVTNV